MGAHDALTKQPLSMSNAMERRSTFAAITVGKSFCPCPSVLSRRICVEDAVDKNAANEGVISAAASRVAVRIISTAEEQMIANTVCRFLGLSIRQ